MDIEAFSELFPLFSTANPETIEWLLSVTTEHEYPAERTVLMEDSWGNAVYFIESGWIKVRRLTGDNETVTLAIMGEGDFFGEMSVLDESPRSTDVVALSTVKLFSVSAQRFIQLLFKDPQLHHKMLQLMVRRLRNANARFYWRKQPPALKLVKTLLLLAENYGQPTDQGMEIIQLSVSDLADVADITPKEVEMILSKLEGKGWIEIGEGRIHLINFKQLTNLANRA
ncbi:transcriptional regulator with cyclic nucleotide binding domain protein [[Synechococcus] sp. NIES-970]|uniref:Crp/Fnr family transcriptional regulator n=1 Tax=Picosynechococcus sp. NKBG15041c TaxID=1407650 RepID=UPI00041E9796|nr:Crp/Fnr family transcriptional regulator [Picosynechococcus sp. NKBG15041c]BAW97163.1 transcriptional regulator with cyclic nucleotide binding domain protein [[Synechococcus] sp. NIES-970]